MSKFVQSRMAEPSLLRLVLVVFLMPLLISSCTDGSIESEPSGRQSGGEVQHANEGAIEGTNEGANDAYPADRHDDDYQGLIVTGLNDQPAEDTVSPWLVLTRTFRKASKPDKPGDAVVELARYDDVFPVSAHLDFFNVEADSCLLRQIDVSPEESVEDPPPPGIHGGQTVIINSESGPWFTFEARQGVDRQILYDAANQLPGMLPVSANLSIPGATFPNVAAYPLYEPEPVQRRQPDPALPVTEVSPLSWVAGQENTLVKIDWLAFDGNDRFLGYPASCWVVDDGSFVPTAEIQVALGAISDRLSVRYSRLYARLDLVNGIVFYQLTEVAE